MSARYNTSVSSTPAGAMTGPPPFFGGTRALAPRIGCPDWERKTATASSVVGGFPFHEEGTLRLETRTHSQCFFFKFRRKKESLLRTPKATRSSRDFGFALFRPSNFNFPFFVTLPDRQNNQTPRRVAEQDVEMLQRVVRAAGQHLERHADQGVGHHGDHLVHHHPTHLGDRLPIVF